MEEKKATGWANLNGISDQEKTCGLNNMNCITEEDSRSCSLNDMNCLADEDKTCALDDMNCLGEDQ